MILFTAASAAIVYFNFGNIPQDYGISLFTVGFVVTLLGQALTHTLMRALGRRSIIIFAMVVLLVAADVLMYVRTGFAVAEAASHGLSDMFHLSGICSPEHN